MPLNLTVTELLLEIRQDNLWSEAKGITWSVNYEGPLRDTNRDSILTIIPLYIVIGKKVFSCYGILGNHLTAYLLNAF